jgi:hypothetical protein
VQTQTITFSLFDAGDGDDGQMVNPTEVEVSSDGESVRFAFPEGVTWHCDQRELAALIGG